MQILSRYIIKTIINAILLITLILMGIEVLIAFISELSNIGTGNYGAMAALRFVMLDMPYQLNILFPMAGLVGSLLGLGLLANQSELVVMRASGYSTGQICRAVLLAAFFLVCFATIIGEGIAPYSENLALAGRVNAKNAGQALTTAQGVWLREGNAFIHINEVLTKHKLIGVTIYEFNGATELNKAFYAQNVAYKNHAWLLNDVSQTFLNNNKIVTAHIPQLIWHVALNSHVLQLANSDPRNMSLVNLNRYIDYLKQNGLSASTLQLSFWKRVLQPFSTIVMIFLAVPFIFGPLRTVPMGFRILAGISVGFCFYILNEFFGPLSLLYQIPPIFGAALPTLLFIALGSWLLWRTR